MYPARVAPEFAKQGWEVHGLALAGSHVAQSLAEAGIDTLVYGSHTGALLAVRKILSYLQRERIEVIHCHKSTDMRLAALLATLAPNLRLFYTDHMGARRPKKDAYHRWAYGKTQTVFAISDWARACNLRALPLPASRIKRLYTGIDFAPFDGALTRCERRQVRASLGVHSDCVLIALPGRITPEKGHALLLDALTLLLERRVSVPWACVMIGAPTENDPRAERFAMDLAKRVDSFGLAEQIIFAGFRRDLPACLKAVDIVCIPSLQEPFGLSVLEALAAGTPVIGSSSGAIPELVTDQWGRIVDPVDPIAWADALEELVVSVADGEDLGAAGAKWVRSRFSMGAHVDALIKAYIGDE